MPDHIHNGRNIELLIPASSLEVLKVAVMFGADAVYIGGEAFGLRAKAKNFSLEEMKEGVEFAHAHDVKVYVTANILAHNKDLDGAREYFEELKQVGMDALIISDPGMFTIAKEVLPDVDIHISTQANNTNYATFNFWYKMGARRVVTARELSLEEIKTIRKNIPDDLEIETFIHGAMCISYSGRCLLSSFMAGRDANQGACTHPCRWKYSVVEESRPGEYMPVYENERGTFILSSISPLSYRISVSLESVILTGIVTSTCLAFSRVSTDCSSNIFAPNANPFAPIKYISTTAIITTIMFTITPIPNLTFLSSIQTTIQKLINSIKKIHIHIKASGNCITYRLHHPGKTKLRLKKITYFLMLS